MAQINEHSPNYKGCNRLGLIKMPRMRSNKCQLNDILPLEKARGKIRPSEIKSAVQLVRERARAVRAFTLHISLYIL